MKEQEMDYFTALYDVARIINASLNPEHVVAEIVRSIAVAMNLKAAIIRLLDPKRKKLVLGAVYGLSEKYLQKGPVLIEESGIDKGALAGKTIWLEDAQKDTKFQYRDMAKAEGIKSVLATPLTVENKVIGVLRVYSDRIRRFDEGEIKFLEAAASLSAIALDNAWLHQRLQAHCDLMAAQEYRIDDN